MSLATDVQASYSAQILINASNPQLSSATTLDSTRLSLACTAVQGWFEKYGMTYDSTDEAQKDAAVRGVFARMLIMTGQGGTAEWKTFKEEIEEISLTVSRDRISPSTDSQLDPTEDTINDLPKFDSKRFDGFVPKGPGSAASQE